MNKLKETPELLKARREIIEYFKTHKDNRLSTISEVLGYSKYQVTSTINRHLSPNYKRIRDDKKGDFRKYD